MKRILFVVLIGVFWGCKDDVLEKKGFQVKKIYEDESGKKVVGLQLDSLGFETRPRNVLLTFHPEHRLTPVYKVNYSKKNKKQFTGSNRFHTNWIKYNKGNNWNNNFMPGISAVYGYNFVNISHYNNTTHTENKLFGQPVLIKTLYYPAFSKDTLNFQPVIRNFYMVSVYDEDTNNDGFINFKDLRRFYYFDLNGQNKTALIPKEYSVISSEYDSANDYMYIFARKDLNNNGNTDQTDPINIFWIDLSDPAKTGKQYTSK